MASDFGDFSKDTLGRSEVYSEAYFGTERAEIAGEYTLPDYLPDIAKILSVRGAPILKEKNIESGRIEWKGDVHYNVVYLTPDGSPASSVFAEPFEGGISSDKVAEDCMADILAAVEQTSVKPVNARRMGIKSAVCVRCAALCEKNADTEVRGKQTIEDGFSLEYLREAAKTLDVKTGFAREIMVSEDVELDGGHSSMKDIVSCTVTALLPEVRPRADEAEVNADVLLDLVFESEGGDYCAMHKRLRLSETVSVPGLRPEYECTANVTPGILKASAQNNSYGERRIVELDFPCDIEVIGYANRDSAIVADMYSTACSLETDKASVDTVVFKRIYSSNVSINASASREAAGLSTAKSVVDGSVALEDNSFTYLPEKRKIIAEGTASVNVIVRDDDENKAYRSGSFKFPYKIEIDSNEEAKELRLVGRAAVLDQRYRMDTSNVYGDIEVGVQIAAFEKGEQSYVRTATLDKSTSSEMKCNGFTLYYPEANETLWDVAKKYQISRKSLEDANAGRERSVMLIPNKYTKTPAFSKIV